MKRIILVLMVMASFSLSAQEIQPAFGLDATVNSTVASDSLGHQSGYSSVGMTIFFQSALTDQLLLQPYFKVTLLSMDDLAALVLSSPTAAYSQNSFGGGLGVFRRFHLADNLSADVGFSGGLESTMSPSTYMGDYLNLRLVADFPVSLQFSVQDNSFYRIGFKVSELSLRYSSIGTTQRTEFSVWENVFLPTVGAGWTF